MSFRIELAGESDLPQIEKLFKESILKTCVKDYTPQQRKAWSSKPNNWGGEKLEGQYFLVAKSDGKILGFASLKGNDLLDFMYVHKDFQRMGVAKKLYGEIEKMAVSQNAKTLKSEVSITARPFFEKMGFKVITRQTKVLEAVKIDNFKMKKTL